MMLERMTVAEFLALPGDSSHLELHDGRVVTKGPGHARQCHVWNRLADLIGALGRGRVSVCVKMPFRALPEYELRDAAVGAVAPERWAEALEQDAVRGVPELVVEAVSPSSTAADVFNYERLCLANGCREFWLVDAWAKEVRVMTGDQGRIYTAGMEIPVLVLDGERIAVDAIFSR